MKSDASGFKIGDSTTNIQYLVASNAPSIVFHDSSELVTVLEMISRTSRVKKSLSTKEFIIWKTGFLLLSLKNRIAQHIL